MLLNCLFDLQKISGWWDVVIQNALGGAIGSCIGILSSYGIYKLTIRQQDIDRGKINEDLLIYFRTLVRRALEASTQEEGYLDSFIKQIEDNPLEFPLLTFVPTYDMKRIVESTTTNSMLIAYQRKFGYGKDGVKEFGEIISNIDYLYMEMEWLPDQIEKGQKYDYERKIRLAALFERAQSTLGQYVLAPESDPDLVVDIDSLMEKFYESGGDNYDIRNYHDNFFVVYNDYFVNVLAQGVKNPFIVEMAQLTRDGKQVFESIRAENINNAKALDQTRAGIKKANDELGKVASRLLA